MRSNRPRLSPKVLLRTPKVMPLALLRTEKRTRLPLTKSKGGGGCSDRPPRKKLCAKLASQDHYEHAWPSGRRRQTHNLLSVRTSQVQTLLHAIKVLLRARTVPQRRNKKFPILTDFKKATPSPSFVSILFYFRKKRFQLFLHF